MKTVNFFLRATSFVILVLFSSCASKTAVEKTITHCFKNEQPYEQGKMKDVTFLQLTVNGAQVVGKYDWLPAEKDQRKGVLSGTISNQVITAKYTFTQEGQKEECTLKITLLKDRAIIDGPDKLGVDETLLKVSCH